MTTITISYNGVTDVYEDGIKVLSTSAEQKVPLQKSNNVKKVQIVPAKEVTIKKTPIVDVFNSKFYLPNYEQDLIQGLLYRNKSYFEQGFLVKTKEYIPAKNAIIIDIGANIGNHTLYWANEVNAKKIYAFEPVPTTFKILKKNIKINNLENIVNIYQAGLSDEDSKGEIKTYDPTNIGGTRLQINNEGNISLITLDSLKLSEKRIDLIKIDVEGMDYKVLTGAVKTIRKYKPVIMIESFPQEYNISSRILKALGYRLEKNLGSFEYIYVYEK